MDDTTTIDNSLSYNAAIWNVRTVHEAKRVILMEGGGLSPLQRWEIETPLLVEQILDLFPNLGPNAWVLDYGCGIGRLAKPLIERTGCRVIGVDISPSMRALSANYVASERFAAMPPEMVMSLNIRFDLALTVWALQHAEDLPRTIELLRNMLFWNRHLVGSSYNRGKLFVLNDIKRVVPTMDNVWADDGLDVRAMLREAGFIEMQHGAPHIGIDDAPEWAFWAVYMP